MSNENLTTILVLDDTPVNLHLAKRLLRGFNQEKGFTVETAATINDAKSILAQLPAHAKLIAMVDENLGPNESSTDFVVALRQQYQAAEENLLTISISAQPDKLTQLVDIIKVEMGGFETVAPAIFAFAEAGTTQAVAAFKNIE